MQSVTIEKDKLREVLVANKEQHQQEYNEAIEGYKKAFDKQLMLKRRELKKGSIPNTHFTDLPKPREYTGEYEQVLKMLDFSVDDTIELTHDEFSNYVLDDWGWKQSFNLSSSNYK